MTRDNRRTSVPSKVLTDQRGAAAVVVAMSATAMVGMMALAIDVSSAVSAHARLRQAADTAALAAVRQAVVLTTNANDPNLAADQYLKAAAEGVLRFNAQSGAIPQVTLDQPPTVVVSPGTDTNIVQATVEFHATYQTQLARMLSSLSSSYGDIGSIKMSATVGAQQTVGAFVDIQVLMDTSNSMTIGATAADQANLQWITNFVPLWPNNGTNAYSWQGCSVACHSTWSGGFKVAPTPTGAFNTYLNWKYNQYVVIDPQIPAGLNSGYDSQPPLAGGTGPLQEFYLAQARQRLGADFSPNIAKWPIAYESTYSADTANTYDTYALARWLNVKLRIDLLKDSASDIASALVSNPNAAKFRFGLYTFDQHARENYTLGAPSSAATAINAVQVTPVDYPAKPTAQSYIGQSVGEFTGNVDWVQNSGDGSLQKFSKRVLVFMSDGVEDTVGYSGQAFGPFVAGSCDTLRTPVSDGGKGYEIYVIQAANRDSFISAAQLGVDYKGNPIPVINEGVAGYADGSSWTQDETFNASVAAMTACAGDSTHFFLASEPGQIKAATAKIIALALSHPTVLQATQVK